MKKNLILLITIVVTISCKQAIPEIKIIEITKAQEVVLNSDNLIKSELKITGMTCAIGCAATIEKKLNKTPGIQSAKVDFENAIAQIIFDPNWIKDQELTNIIQEVGSAYEVTDNKRVDSFSVLK
jgi:Cu+-exporting ATPase|tara:strand:+ start:1789 stop:2163 length:375 start_codon:yes stop_codon:yes gene_type:complete